MDRRYGHRAVLAGAVAGGLALAGTLRAQGPAPMVPNAAATATPWVRASLPGPPPSALPPKDEIARAMARKREEELARQTAAFPAAVAKPLPPRPPPRLSPEENAAYERNLAIWRALPPEEKKEIRTVAAERIKEETDNAYAGSGLNLNADQREVFALRYRQERRRLERDLQEKATAERARRMPEIMDRLRHEFGPPGMPAAPTPAIKF